MENAITDLLDKIIPQINTLLSDLRLWMGILLYVAPAALILYGLFCFFLSPPEANHRMGFRSIYGMGSVRAWKWSQKFAGIVLGGTGILLLISAIIGSVLSAGKALSDAMTAVIIILIIQASLTLAAYIGIEVTLIVRYDLAGNLRSVWKQRRAAKRAGQ